MPRENAVIFGASAKGKEAFDIFNDKYSIIAFSDNDKGKWGAEFCGIKIISPDRIKELGDVTIIVASMHWSEISSQLYGMGLSNIMIFFSEHNERTAVKYKLIPMCDADALSVLHVNEGDGRIFAEDFERLFDGAPVAPPVRLSDKVIYRDKNVLFFAYYFPPIGSSGVQRSLKFVKYLKELGWNPIVVSCGSLSRDFAMDDSLLSDIPDDVTVIRIDDRTTIADEISGKEMQHVVNLLFGASNDCNATREFIEKIKENRGSQRKYLFHPQNFTMWVLDVLSGVSHIIDFSKIQAVYTTSGPFISSLIGYYIKNKYNKPWVADFRDPWTQGIKMRVTPEWLSKLEFSLEKNILENADHIITFSHICTDDYKNIFSIPEEKVSLIINGYDEVDFKTVDTKFPGSSDKLKIIFNGILNEPRSNPISFINAVSEAISDGILDKNSIDIEIVGERKPKSLEDKIRKADIHNVVTLKPYMEHVESLRNLSNANVLLIIINDNDGATNMYTGKLFEYLRMHRRILAVVPDGCLMKHVLDETGTGVCIAPDDKDGMIAYLRDTLAEIRSGKALDINYSEIERYDRRKGTGMLADILDKFLMI